MAFYPGNENDRKDYRHRDDEDFRSNVYRLDSRSESPRLDDEKKIRREIANSNERRRMQSINAGFQSLRSLLPKGECDKLSKAAILQGTVEYVQQLQQEKSFLLSQNIKLTRSVQSSNDSDGSCSDLPLPKRKRRKTELVSQLLDEGIGSASPSSQSETEDAARLEIVQLRQQLEQERAWRLRLETELRERETRLQARAKRDHDYTEELTKTTSSKSHLTLQEHEIVLHHPTTMKQEQTLSDPPRHTPIFYNPHGPRQNLAAIVEAIRHVEGYHMFQDDDSPFSSNVASPEPAGQEPSFESQIISRAPVVQNRAGVIVSNTS